MDDQARTGGGPEGAPASSTTAARRAVALAIALPFAVGLVCAWRFLPFVADDALISLRYADRLLSGHGLSWTDGPPVEGYSNLLWILLAAGLGALGVDLIDAVRVLGVLSSLLVAAALAALVRPRRPGEVGAVWLGAVLVVATGPWAAWTVGGLESVGAGAALAWGVVSVRRLLDDEDPGAARVITLGLPFAALCLLRPDGPLLAGMLGGALVVLVRPVLRGLRRAVLLGVPSVVAVLGQLAFRVAYYDDTVPNTAHIKAAFGTRWLEGWTYVGSGLVLAIPALLVGTAAFFGERRAGDRGIARAVLVALVGWCAYVAAVGGDIFPAFRLLVPVYVLAGALAALGAHRLLAERAVPWAVLAGSVVVVGAGVAAVEGLHPAVEKAARERWEWRGLVTGRALARGFEKEQPLLAVTAAGSLPYFSRLPALDMAGLNDRHIALAPPEPGGRLAHDHADAAYVLERAPDLMVFGTAEGRNMRLLPARQMERQPAFRRDYRLVHYRGLTPWVTVTHAWTRRTGKLGVRRTDDEVRIPGWHLGDDPVAQPSAEGPMVARLVGRRELRSDPIRLERGVWRVTVEPPGARLRVEATVDGGDRLGLRRTDGHRDLIVAEAQEITLLTTPAPVEVLVSAVVLTRVEREASVAETEIPPWVLLEDNAGRWSEHRRLFTFDEVSEVPWSVEGSARRRADPDRPGESRLTTRDEGWRRTGLARSPPFVVPPAAALQARLGGRGRCSLRVRVGAEVFDAVAAKGRGELREVRFDLSRLAGREVHLELADVDDEPGAFAELDDVVLLVGPTAR